MVTTIDLAEGLVLDIDMRDVLVALALTSSRSSAKKLLDAGAVWVDGSKYVRDEETFFMTWKLPTRPYFKYLRNGATIQVGHRAKRARWTNATIPAIVEDLETT